MATIVQKDLMQLACVLLVVALIWAWRRWRALRRDARLARQWEEALELERQGRQIAHATSCYQRERMNKKHPGPGSTSAH